MNEDFFFGDNRILFVKIGGEFLPVACLTTNSMAEISETLPTTTRQNENGWSTSVPTKQNFTISFEGLQINTYFGGDDTKVSYDRLKALKRSRSIFDWELRTLDGLFVDYGKGFITELSETAPVEDYLTFSGTLTGFGEPNFTSNYLDNITFDNDIIEFSNTVVKWDNE